MATAPSSTPSRTEALAAAWRAYFLAEHQPAHPASRDAMNRDLVGALGRLIPPDATVLEAGCGRGDLLAALPQRDKAGFDSLPEIAAAARALHPNLRIFEDDATAPPDASTELADAVVCDRLVHSVLDVRALLLNLKARLKPGGRLYLTAFSYFWEIPARLAELAGWKRPAPTANWLSASDLENLFRITGLEVVRYEDRLLLPLDVPGLSQLLNRYLGRLPGLQPLSLYRVYVLRKVAETSVALSGPAQETAGAPGSAETPVPGAGSARPSVSVIVPTRNEAGNVQAALDRTPVMGAFTELIFVEGGSSDGTWETIQTAMASYRGPLRVSAYQQTGKGKGDAVRLGFAKARGDLLMILDADLTVPPEDLPPFYDVAVSGQADYVQGTRLVYPMEPGAMRFFNKLGNVAFSRLFTYLLQQPIKDTLCGTKVIWRRDWERLVAGRAYFGDFDPFGDFDLIFGVSRLNLKIAEIPVRYRDRVYGETNIQRWKHGVLLLRMSAIAARKLKFV